MDIECKLSLFVSFQWSFKRAFMSFFVKKSFLLFRTFRQFTENYETVNWVCEMAFGESFVGIALKLIADV